MHTEFSAFLFSFPQCLEHLTRKPPFTNFLTCVFVFSLLFSCFFPPHHSCMFYFHFAFLPPSCVSCRHLVFLAAIWCFLPPSCVSCRHLVFLAAIWCFLPPSCVSCRHLVFLAAILCFLPPCLVLFPSFGKDMKHSHKLTHHA